MKPILDMCCGSRMFYFDKQDDRVLFNDIRDEEYVLCDGRILNITPDVISDFKNLPLPDNTFYQVLFDPPHLIIVGKNSWMFKNNMPFSPLHSPFRDHPLSIFKVYFIPCRVNKLRFSN